MTWTESTGPPGDGDDEELAVPRTIVRRPWLAASLALAGLAAVGIAVVAVHAGRHTAEHRPLPSSAPATASRSLERPSLVALPSDPGCPVGATCSEAVQLPVDTLSALYGLLPDVAVVHSVSVLANRPGHFQPDLLSRRVDGAFDGGEIVLRVVRTAGTGPTRTGPATRAEPTRLGASATARQPGFVVTIAVHGGTAAVRSRLHRPATLTKLRRLAGDTALLEPQ